MPLLQLLARLRTVKQADPALLRERMAVALESFEARATAAGHSADHVRRAHYALCSSLDEAAQNTPWGANSNWAQHGMVARFHPRIGPGRFADALRQAEAKVDSLRPVLEVMALCLSLGPPSLAGTQQASTTAETEALRTGAIATLLRGKPAPPDQLSDQWVGMAAPFRRQRRHLPVWVAAVLGLAVAGGAWLLLSAAVNQEGDAVFARMLAAPPARMPELAREAPPPPPPPAPAEPTVRDRLRDRLAALESAGAVTVAGTSTTPVLRLPEEALFTTGSAAFKPGIAPLLNAVAEALRPEGGRLRVLGYTDDRPFRSVAFPSAFRLSAARAETVRGALSRALGSSVPIVAEGRAGADPVADNGTADGRAQNRRIEIVLAETRP